MSNIYCIKTKKKIDKKEPTEEPLDKKRKKNSYALKTMDYTLRVIFQCPKGHLFYEEWHKNKIDYFGIHECVEDSISKNENIICPECLNLKK